LNNLLIRILFAFTSFVRIFSCSSKTNYLQDGFVYLKDVAPDIGVDLKYYSNNAIISIRTASVLKDMAESEYGIKVFDAYRPQRTVNHFV